jgi:FlaA1/EpsC-like NDP-sugar epimerase
MKKRLLLFTIDAVVLLCAAYSAYLLKFYPDVKIELLGKFFFLIIMVELISLQLASTYQWSFHLANVNEFVSLGVAVLAGGLTSYVFAGCFGAWILWQFFVINAFVALLLISLFRFSVRLRNSIIWGKPHGLKKALIIGAGEAGEAIVKKMKQDPSFGYLPVAFIDDDPRKKGIRIRGVKVVGDSACIPDIVLAKEIEQIIITMPSASGSTIRKVVRYCEKTNARVKILPGIWEIILGDAYLHQIRDIQPEDLLGRETVKIDTGHLQEFYENKVVLVTGACGSIGNELVQQLGQFSLRNLVALDRNENEMYYLQYRDVCSKQEIPLKNIIPVLADVTDEKRMREIFETYHPDIIFHAAAYKHVPLMERFPHEAVKNNIESTRIVANLAEEYHIEYFTLISTDKAVRPKNIMGYTKRIAELIVQAKAERSQQVKFLSVRFGNVLGSNGSIIPILKRQIKNGGPVTVTSKEAKRYFMTISEAVQLILQATSMAHGGEIFVLDMGEQVSIDALAHDMIRLMGLVPGKDIKIEYTGMRPGEKLEEDLFENKGEYQASSHDKILVALNGHTTPLRNIEKDILHLLHTVNSDKHFDETTLREMLKVLLTENKVSVTD